MFYLLIFLKKSAGIPGNYLGFTAGAGRYGRSGTAYTNTKAQKFCHMYDKDCSKSDNRSRQSSIPTDTRTRPAPMPASSSSRGVMPECVVVFGWQASDSTPPRDTALR